MSQRVGEDRRSEKARHSCCVGTVCVRVHFFFLCCIFL